MFLMVEDLLKKCGEKYSGFNPLNQVYVFNTKTKFDLQMLNLF